MLGRHGTCEYHSLIPWQISWLMLVQNGGHCQPGVYYPPPDIAEFELRNYDSIKSLIAKHNIPCEWKTLNGCHNYMSESMFDLAVAQVEALRAYSPKLAEMVKVITKESTNPSLLDLRIPRAAGAIVQEKAASLWPYKFVAWILEDLIKTELLNLQTTTPVTSLQKVDSGWIVHTPRGMLAAPKVLLCTNAYTSALIPEFSDLIVPVRGEMSALIPPASMKPANTSNHPLELSYVFLGNEKQNINQDDYLVQHPFSTASSGQVGGELMFGGARMYAAHAGVGVSDDSAIDEPAAAYLRRELNIVLDLQNDCKDLKASHEWSGIMGYSRDGHPWVGEVTEEMGGIAGAGLWVCAGFTGHGMPNTWLSAAAAADLIMGKEIEKVDLPTSYALTMERIAKARSYDEVWLADSKGIF